MYRSGETIGPAFLLTVPAGKGRLHSQFPLIRGSTILNSIGQLFAPFPGLDWVIPYHSFELSFNSSPLCTRHSLDAICATPHILYQCPALVTQPTKLAVLVEKYNLPINTTSILSIRLPLIIIFVIRFFKQSSFVI